jgi:hypothetical protein
MRYLDTLPTKGWIAKGITHDPTTQCWVWKHPIREGHYAMLRVYRESEEPGGQPLFKFHLGELPKNKTIRYTCDTRQCCNPLHFRWKNSRKKQDSGTRNQAGR